MLGFPEDSQVQQVITEVRAEQELSGKITDGSYVLLERLVKRSNNCSNKRSRTL